MIMVTFKIIQFFVVFVWILNLQYIRAINSRYPLAAKRTASRQVALMLFTAHVAYGAVYGSDSVEEQASCLSGAL